MKITNSKLLIILALAIFTTKQTHAVEPTNYGRIFNVQDYIATTSTIPGLSNEQRTLLGINRCFTTVAHMVYAATLTTTSTSPEQNYTIIFPLDIYKIDNMIAPYKININGSVNRILVRDIQGTLTGNDKTKVTIHIIGLRENNNDLNSAFLANNLPIDATATLSNNFVQSPFNQYYYIPTNYWLNGAPGVGLDISSNPGIQLYLNSVIAKTNIQDSGHPEAPNYLYGFPTIFPEIISTNPISHNFISLITTGVNGSEPWNQSNNTIANTAINIMGLKMTGKESSPSGFAPWTNTHIYDKFSDQHNVTFNMGTAVYCSNFKSYNIDNNIIQNIYGNGIYLNNRFYAYLNGICEVDSNEILNVWGLRYKLNGNRWDDEGDGISFQGIINGHAYHNIVHNNIDVTKQFGRVGLATMCENDKNCKTEFNSIKGYDRGMHSENNLGGFIITNNRIVGSETGIVYDDNRNYRGAACPDDNPSTISNNYISNEEIPDLPDLQKEYPAHLIWSGFNQSTDVNLNTLIENNTFVIDKSFIRNYASVDPDPRPSPTLNYSQRFHISSGLRQQQINCNTFVVKNPNLGWAFKAGGTELFSFCPYNQNIDPNVCSFACACLCTPGDEETSTPKLSLNNNTYINCFENYILHGTNSISSIGNNFFINQSTFKGTFLNNSEYTKQITPNPTCTSLPLEDVYISTESTNISCTGVAGSIKVNSISPNPPVTISIFGPTTASPIQNSGTFTNLVAGIYTITATDSGTPTALSTSTVVTIYDANMPNAQFCCNPTLAISPNMQLLLNPTASSLIAQFGNQINNKQFFIDGTFTVNADFNIGASYLYFAPNAKINIINKSTCSIINCNLQSGCNTMWQGIFADDDDQKVVCNSSQFQDMLYGINLSNGAQIDCQYNNFFDNKIGIYFYNTPLGYSSGGGGVVLNNNFTTYKSHLLAPYSSETKGDVGIFTRDCRELQIGDLIKNSSNVFKNIRNGIYVRPPLNLTYYMNFYNNRYVDIHYDFGNLPTADLDLVNSFYSQIRGSGIFIKNSHENENSNNLGKVRIESIPNQGGFTNCDKAAVGSKVSVHAARNIVDNCKGGFLFNNCTGQDYRIEQNKMDNIFLGIQLLGNLHEAVIYNHKETEGGAINTQNQGIATNVTDEYIWPKAIDVRYATPSHNGALYVVDNDIDLNAKAGIGINIIQTGKYTDVSNNLINFKTLDNTIDQVGNISYSLVGIQAQFATQATISCNRVNGIGNASWLNRNSQGMLFYESQAPNLRCNEILNTRLGMLVFGSCHSNAPEDIKGNTIDGKQRFGMLFAPSIPNPIEGSFGQIGDDDHENRFLGVYFNPQQQRVYEANTAPPVSSYDLSTTQNFNIGSNFGNSYNIVVAKNHYECDNTGCNNYDLDLPHGEHIDPDYANQVINDLLQFPIFPEVSQFMAEYKLYANLAQDSNVRAANPTYNGFYQQKQQEPLGAIYQANEDISYLSDSLAFADTLAFQSRIQQAMNTNNQIISTKNYESNEKWINELHFKIMLYGNDTLNTLEVAQLETLAKSCPAIEGQAVYKARVLYATYEPALEYSDFAICNAQLSNKNGSGGYYNDMMNFINQPPSESIEVENLVSIKTSEYSLWPVPANQNLTIKYNFLGNSDGKMLIFDIMGNQVKEIFLANNIQTVTTSIRDLMDGLYSYKIMVDNKQFTGKISILK